VLDEISRLKDLGFKGYIFLVDDNFIGNKKNAKVMLAELARWSRDNDYPFAFLTEASINLADDEQLLQAMSDAGFLSVFIGIETPDPKLLKTTLKNQNIPGDPLQKLRRIRSHGIHVTAGFIIGFDGETRHVFEAQRTFIEASGIGVASVAMLSAIPHTQLARRLKAEGRLLEGIDVRANLTQEGINFIPKGELTKREYLEGYRRLITDLYAPDAFFKRIRKALLDLQHVQLRAVRGLCRSHYPGLFRLLYHLGVKRRGARTAFWKTVLYVLLQNPAALEALAHDCYFFYRLSIHADDVSNNMAAYLSSPSPDDVLDEVLRDSVPAHVLVSPQS
jgi:radical SAM superfamily enzyme YgiQ (UPF0313 family)